ncbi:MAG: amidohydrolase family protein [Candidatus Helarchaeota archaeon]
MSESTIFCKYGLLGDNLELKKNVRITFLGGKIEEVEINTVSDKADIQYPKCIALPGFINAHVHIGDSFAKDQGLNLSIQELVEPPLGLKHRLLNNTSGKEIVNGMELAIQEMLSMGITTFIDFRESGKEGIMLLKSALENETIHAFICGRPFPSLEALSEVLTLSDGIGLSSSNIYSDEELIQIKRNSKNQNKLILVHVAETKQERDLALKKYNSTEIDRVINLLDADVLVHCIWMDEEDIKLIAERKKAIVVCPRSNSHLNVGYPPFHLIMKYNLLTCLGTDNVMINNLNLFREMEYLFKHSRLQFGINTLSTYDILKMITINPARALQLESMIGSIDVEKLGNLTLIDLSAPNLIPFQNVYDTLVLRANPLNIKNVFLKGEKVYER